MKNVISIVFTVMLVFAISGCENLLPKEVVAPSTQVYDNVNDGITTEMNAAGSGLVSSADIAALLSAGQAEVKKGSLTTSTDCYAIIPVYVKGMQSAIPSTAIYGNELALQVVNEMIITSAVITAENVSSSRSARAAFNGNRMAELINTVSAEIFSNLSNCGINDTSLASTTKAISALITDSLITVSSQGMGITEDELPLVMSAVIEAGVSSTVKSELSQENKKAVLEAIVEGSSQPLVNYNIDYDKQTALMETIASQAVVAVVAAANGEDAAVQAGLIDSTVQGVASGLDLLDDYGSGAHYVAGIVQNIVTDLAAAGSTDTLQPSINSVVGSMTIAMIESAGLGDYVLVEAVEAIEAIKQELDIDDSIIDSGLVISDTKIAVANDPDTQGTEITVDDASIKIAKAKADRVLKNNVPVFSVPEDKYTFVVNEGDEVAVSFTVSDADTMDTFTADWFFWEAELGMNDIYSWESPEMVTSVTLQPKYAGEYNFNIWVYESINFEDGSNAGSESYELKFTVIVNAVTEGKTKAELAELAIDKGLTRMYAQDFTGALSAFDEARQLDPENNEAKLWWSFMYLADIAVDPAIVSIANDMGMYEYPDRMTDLLNPWGTTMRVSTDMSEYGESFIFLPKVKIPAGYMEHHESMYGGKSPAVLDTYEYMLILVRNLLSNNPDGFNSIIDSASGALDTRISKVKEVLNTIPADAIIAFTKDTVPSDLLIEDHPVTDQWPQVQLVIDDVPQVDEFGDKVMVNTTIDIGKAEIDIITSTMDLLNSVIHLFRATSFNADVYDMFKAINPVDGSAYIRINGKTSLNPHFNWADYVHPYEVGAFQAREDADVILAAAKASFLSSMKGYQSAVQAVAARTTEQTFFFGPGSPDSTMEGMFSSSDSGDGLVLEALKVGDILFGKIIDSVEKGTTLIAPTSFMDADGNLDLATYTDPKAWPDTISYDPSNATPAVNLSVLFDKALIDINNFIQIDEQKNPVFYELQYDADGIVTGAKQMTADDLPSLKAQLPTMSSRNYGLKIPDLTLGGLLIDSEGKELKAFADAILSKVMGLKAFHLVYEEDGSLALFTDGFPAIAPYLALAPKDTVLFRDDLDYVYKTTGSFWTGIAATQDAWMSDVIDINVGEEQNLVLDSYANIAAQYKIQLDPNKVYEAILSYPDSGGFDTYISMYETNISSSAIYDISGVYSYDADNSAIVYSYELTPDVSIISLRGWIYEDEMPVIPEGGVTISLKIREVVDTATPVQ